jgi:hypothetical protein
MGEVERNLLTCAFLIGMLTGATVSVIIHAILDSRRKIYEDN